MPSILDVLEGAESPISQVPDVIAEVEAYINEAWHAGIAEAVDLGSIPESVAGDSLASEGVAAAVFSTAVEGAGLAITLVSLIGVLVLLVLLLIAIAIVAFHRQIRHVCESIPVVGGVLAGWEDDSYNLIRPILHGIEQQLIQQVINIVLDLRKLVQWLYGIDPQRLIRFLEHYVGTKFTTLTNDLTEIQNLVHWITANLQVTVSHLWSNVHALWSRLTYLEGLYNVVQQEITNVSHALQTAFHDIASLWSYAGAILAQVQHLAQLLDVAQHHIQVQEHEINQLKHDLYTMMDHVAWLESIVVPAAGLASVVGVLMPLADAGRGGIDNLVKTANGECICPPEPPDMDASQCGWLEKILSAAGRSTHA